MFTDYNSAFLLDNQILSLTRILTILAFENRYVYRQSKHCDTSIVSMYRYTPNHIVEFFFHGM